jgi:hypothetical protein
VIVDHDTQLEFLTYSRKRDLLSVFFTVLVGDGSTACGWEGGRPAWCATR